MAQGVAHCTDNRPMNDSQIEVPESFLALFRTGGMAPGASAADGAFRASSRLNQPAHHILARYETCEDLAQGLAPQARALVAELGVMPVDVAERMAAGLVHPSVGLAPEEAQWVCTRLVELLEHGL